jgi:hypothetical protein
MLAASCLLMLYNYRINEWNKVSFDKLPDEKLNSEDTSAADTFRYFSLFTDFMQVAAIVLGSDYAFNFWGAGDGIDELSMCTTAPLYYCVCVCFDT